MTTSTNHPIPRKAEQGVRFNPKPVKMKKEDVNNIKSQMRKGILELCVLRLLHRGEAYPSDIIKAMSQANLVVVEGTIYTLLNRLRREGKLDYLWRESRQGPPRKYFFLTDFGLEALGAMNEAWAEIEKTVNHFASPALPTSSHEKDI